MNVKIILDTLKSIKQMEYKTITQELNLKYNFKIQQNNLSNMLSRGDMKFSLLERIIKIMGVSILFVDDEIVPDILKDYPNKVHYFPSDD